ncbi:MAG: RIP metalloprotease RseP [Proteobacteria bacterium]|nr:RIP metalloprotease RseP [Pseudomonadota bacterium]
MTSSSIFDWTRLIAENIWLYGGAFVLVLSILVFIHEWGHYIVARLCGVKVESFSIGFGRELFGITDKHGTRWKFALIPLGGYVKMFGDVDPASARHLNGVEEGDATGKMRPLTTSEQSVAFFAKPVMQRFAIVLAGPAINYLFAVFVLACLYVFYGQPVTPPVGTSVIGGSAAERAGFQPHDEILSIDGKQVRDFDDIRREVMVGLDTERVFEIRRAGKVIKINAAAERKEEEDHFGFKHTRGFLGLISPGNALQIEKIVEIDGKPMKDVDVARAALLKGMGMIMTITLDRGLEQDKFIIQPLAEFNGALKNPDDMNYNNLVVANIDDEVFVRFGVLNGIGAAVRETIDITRSTLDALGQMVTGTRSATELGGIIRIGAIAGDMAKSGIIALITFTALLSINLGLINLFPIPMLDGGHLLFYVIEIVKGTPISEQIQEYAFRLGLVILVGIMVFANLNDIMQLIL